MTILIILLMQHVMQLIYVTEEATAAYLLPAYCIQMLLNSCHYVSLQKKIQLCLVEYKV